MVVPKAKGEALGVVIVESGWGSVLPTVILANMSPTGAAARCGQLNIGDQIMSVNGISLVGLPLSTCQEHVKVRRVPELTGVKYAACVLYLYSTTVTVKFTRTNMFSKAAELAALNCNM